MTPAKGIVLPSDPTKSVENGQTVFQEERTGKERNSEHDLPVAVTHSMVGGAHLSECLAEWMSLLDPLGKFPYASKSRSRRAKSVLFWGSTPGSAKFT